MFLANFGTFATYFFSIYYMKDYIDVSLIDYTFTIKVFILTLISWFPLHIIRWYINKYHPTEEQKIVRYE